MLHRRSQIWSHWTRFHFKFVWLTDIVKKNSYPDKLINNYIKRFLDNKHRIEENLVTVPKKPFFPPYPGPSTLQITTKLGKSIKVFLNFCKLHIAFKSQNKLSNVIHLKDHFPKELTSICKLFGKVIF